VQVLLSGGGYPLILADDNGTLTPVPDYWVALLHKRLMGTAVLNVSLAAEEGASRLRAYAHCARAPTGRVTLTLINLSPDTLSVGTGPLAPSAGTRDEWHLTPGPRLPGLSRLQSASTLLSGVALNVLPGPELPSLAPRTVDASTGPITLAAQSIAFVVVTDNQKLCAMSAA